VKSGLIGSSRPKILVHEKSGVEQVLRDCGLKVVRSICVDKSRNGTDYNIYLLEKAQ
jgi:hypothetical protein